MIARNQDSCPEQDALTEFALGEPAEEVESHLLTCAQCREQIQEFRDNESFLRALPPLGVELASPFSEVAHVAGYDIVSEIHRGGQGAVYEAIQIETKRPVALKVLLRGELATARERRRFEREIELAASLRHPNIVTLYERVDLPDGRLAFSMELVTGRPIDAWNAAKSSTDASAEATRSLRKKLALFVKVCEAIQFAHQRGIIHRDLKPANIFVDDDGEPRVLDFGLAKVSTAAKDAHATQSGEFLGTLAYASPEQVEGDSSQVDTRSDVYSLGVILYRLIVQQPPYAVDGPISDVIDNISNSEAPPPSRINGWGSRDVDVIVMMALAKDSDRRYRSAGDLALDLQRYLSGDPVLAHGDSRWYRIQKGVSKHRALMFGACVCLCLTLAFVLSLNNSYRDTRRLLRRSNLERGRHYADLGAIAVAENLLWTEHLDGEWAVAAGRSEGPGGVPLDSNWALWHFYAKSSCLRTFEIKESTAVDLEFRPGSTASVATAAWDGNVCLWNDLHLWTENQQPTLLGVHAGGAIALSFSADGKYLASAGASDGLVKIWQVESGQLVRTLRGQVSLVSPVSFSPIGDSLLLQLEDGRLHYLRDVHADARILTTPSTESPAQLVTFEETGSAVYWASRAEPSTLWRVPIDGTTPSVKWASLEKAPLTAVQESSSFGLVSVKGEAGFSLYDREQQQHLAEPLLKARSVHFANNQRVIGMCHDYVVRIWSTEDLARSPLILLGHAHAVEDVDLSPGGEYLASSDSAGYLKFWQADASTVEVLPGHEDIETTGHFDDSVFDTLYTQDGQTLITASQGGLVIVRDAETGLERSRLPLMQGGIGSIAICPWAPAILAVGGHMANRAISLWDWRSGKKLGEMREKHQDWVSGLAFSERDQTLLSVSGDGTLRVWDMDSLELVDTVLERSATNHRSLHSVDFDSSGTWLAACGRVYGVPKDAHLWVWDWTKQELCINHRLDNSFTARVLAFGSDGTLAAGTDSGAIYMLDVNANESPQLVHAGEGSAIYSLTFDQSGRRLVAGDEAGSLRIWDTTSRALLLRMSTDGILFSLGFHPTQNVLLAGADETTPSGRRLLRWDLDFYNKHIAGNVAHQIKRMSDRGRTPRNARALQIWARGVLATE